MGSTSLTADGWYRAWPPGPRARLVALAVALLVIAGAVVAVVGGDGLTGHGESATDARGLAGDGATAAGGDIVLSDQEAATSADLAAPSPAARAFQPAPSPAVPGIEPRVVKHGVLSIEVTEGSVGDAFDRVADVARGRGGFVVSSSTSTLEEGAASADLTLRVPADQFEAARTDLARVGEVQSVQVSGEDVSAQLVDLDARLRALRAEEDALTALLGEAGNVGEVLAVREQVSATRLEIEQLAAQQAALEDRASFSTLQVSLFEPGVAAIRAEPEPAIGLSRSFEQAIDASVAVVGGMVVVLGYLLPLGVAGLLAWGVQRLVRLRLHRRTA